jgi:hypothetical protein
MVAKVLAIELCRVGSGTLSQDLVHGEDSSLAQCERLLETSGVRLLVHRLMTECTAVSANLLYGFGHVNLQIRVVIIAQYFARLVSRRCYKPRFLRLLRLH